MAIKVGHIVRVACRCEECLPYAKAMFRVMSIIEQPHCPSFYEIKKVNGRKILAGLTEGDLHANQFLNLVTQAINTPVNKPRKKRA